MALWGTANQAVSVTSGTTRETSTGAPMGTHGLVKDGGEANNDTRANAHFGNTSPGSRANTDLAMFGNTTVGAFIPKQAIGIFGVNVATKSSTDGIAHAGWQVKRSGTGPVASISISSQSGQFANGETVKISPTSASGQTNATAAVVTNATGNIVSLSIVSGGSGWTNSTNFSYTWNHDVQWVSNVQIGVAATGYTVGNIIVVSNGTVNATANITATSLTNATMTILNSGLFANTVGIGNVVFSIVNSTMGSTVTGNTTVTGFSVKLANSSGAPTIAAVAGGRAGRVHYETLVAGGSYT